MIVGLAHTSDDELEALGRLNPGWSFERDDDGRVIMSPTHSQSGFRSTEAAKQLFRWFDRTAPGGKLADSSTGFKLSTGAVRSPDASWLSQERIDAIEPEKRTGYWEICPDVTIEVASESSDWELLLEKIASYRREGARYAVAIDPATRRVVELGEPPAGLALDFDAIIDA